MLLISADPCEFRIKRTYVSKNTGKSSFFYTFENDDMGSFELWCSENLPVEKGKLYNLQMDMQIFSSDIRYSLKGISEYKRS